MADFISSDSRQAIEAFIDAADALVNALATEKTMIVYPSVKEAARDRAAARTAAAYDAYDQARARLEALEQP